MHFHHTIFHAEREFFLSEHNHIELVLMYSRVGKVAAGITASAFIEKFQMDNIIIPEQFFKTENHLFGV